MTARYEPRLDDLKATVTSANAEATSLEAKQDFADWQTVVLAELFNPGASAQTASSFAAPAPVSPFSAQRIEEQATVVRALSDRPAGSWSGAFDQSSAFGANSPFSMTAVPGVVVAAPPSPAADPARYAKIRALLLSSVNPKIVDTAIAEGIRQKVDPMIVLSVIDQESNFKKNAYNKGSGCTGR